MMLFRSARASDLNAIHRLAEQSGVGITTLSKDKAILEQRLQLSCNSFKKKVLQVANEYYLFVLENQNQQIVGTSAIEASTGYDSPFYSYRVSERTQISYSLKLRSQYQILHLVNDNERHTEICTLFLDPQYRNKNHNGVLLSKGRFLFMAHHASRFEPIVIAEIRGVSNEQGESPFWTHLGLHFFKMSFAQADRLTLETNKQFIADLMPENPIHVNLLPPQARAVIGQAHPATIPAMVILLKEGFCYNRYIDIFDAGPTIEAPLEKIKTIHHSHLMRISRISNNLSSLPIYHGTSLSGKEPLYLLANTQLDFRATIQYAHLDLHDNSCIINAETARLLDVQAKDELRIVPISP